MCNVVIIDDDEKVRKGMKAIIPWKELHCHFAGFATNGQEGLTLIHDTQPDLIITDIYMPVMNGLDMVESLRKDGITSHIIILSGYSEFEYARKAMRLDIDDYISKPASPQTISDAIRTCMNKMPHSNHEYIVDWKESAKPPLKILHIHDTHSFLSAIRKADCEQAYALIDYIYHYHEKDVFNQSVCIGYGIEIWNLITSALQDLGLKTEDFFDDPFHFHQQLSSQRSWAHFSEWVKSLINQICTHDQWEENIKHRQLVEEMIHFIDGHLSENITLHDLSAELYISRNYLGQIFKRVTGESFKNYLTKVRMEKAKKMIQDGHYMIYEISEAVGFPNPAYFTTTFKKYTGYTPSDMINRTMQS
ncbi:response regulator transcription factor [Paenalkalicoccus suaedae]|uniref:Response regulator transcription factor n=1 Tax=Paenalkalicoccus suaedae TaxID=2592382 RepID=A0A859FA27_9BACI|nr:response regulator transcription factor [Paenalkalicoccus suaedae]QKS69730.1 response regulator transcription factor [Paenalkalicoccus suaedae]